MPIWTHGCTNQLDFHLLCWYVCRSGLCSKLCKTTVPPGSIWSTMGPLYVINCFATCSCSSFCWLMEQQRVVLVFMNWLGCFIYQNFLLELMSWLKQQTKKSEKKMLNAEANQLIHWICCRHSCIYMMRCVLLRSGLPCFCLV